MAIIFLNTHRPTELVTVIDAKHEHLQYAHFLFFGNFQYIEITQ